MGLDATRPVVYPAHVFTRVRIPGEDRVDLAADVRASADVSWNALFDEGA